MGLSGIIGVALNKYVAWYESFWDLRIFLFTSVFLSAMSLIIAGEQSHHRKLVEQSDSYLQFMFCAEQFFQDVLSLFDIHVEVEHFQTEDLSQLFSEMLADAISGWNQEESVLSKTASTRFGMHVNSIDCIVFFLEEFSRELASVKAYSGKLVNNTESVHLASMCDDVSQSIRAELLIIRASIQHGTNLRSVEILEFIKRLHGLTLSIIGYLRRPWRYEPDFSLDTKIRNVLAVEGRIEAGQYNPLSHWMQLEN